MGIKNEVEGQIIGDRPRFSHLNIRIGQSVVGKKLYFMEQSAVPLRNREDKISGKVLPARHLRRYSHRESAI